MVTNIIQQYGLFNNVIDERLQQFPIFWLRIVLLRIYVSNLGIPVKTDLGLIMR